MSKTSTVQLVWRLGCLPQRLNMIRKSLVNRVPWGKYEKNLDREWKEVEIICIKPIEAFFNVTMYLLYHGSASNKKERAQAFRNKKSCFLLTRNWMIYLRTSCSLTMKDWTLVCGKIQGWFLGRGERLIKFRDSWFSVKSIEVECF